LFNKADLIKMIDEKMLIQELQNERAKAHNEQEDLREKMELAAERRRAFDRSIDKVQLLLAKQPKEDIQPQLNKPACYTLLPLAEELWDKYSVHLDTDVDSFQSVAGQSLLTRSDFLKLIEELQLNGQ
jgi:hypothetical protein